MGLSRLLDDDVGTSTREFSLTEESVTSSSEANGATAVVISFVGDGPLCRDDGGDSTDDGVISLPQ